MRLAPGGAGFLCDEGPTDAELEPLDGAFEGVKPGDAFEVHWVYSTCDVAPGPGSTDHQRIVTIPTAFDSEYVIAR